VPWVESAPKARPIRSTVDNDASFEPKEATDQQAAHLPFGWSFPTEFALTHLKETGHYLQWAFTLPYQLASLSYRQLCQGITWFGSDSCINDDFESPSTEAESTGIMASTLQVRTPRPLNWSITPEYLFVNDPSAGSTDLRLNFTKTEGIDIIFRFKGLQEEDYPEWRRANEIQALPAGRMIGLHVQFHF